MTMETRCMHLSVKFNSPRPGMIMMNLVLSVPLPWGVEPKFNLVLQAGYNKA